MAKLLDIEPKDVLTRGKYKQSVKARGLLCYWGTRELKMTTLDLAKKLTLDKPTISQSVKKKKKIAEEEGFKLLEQFNQ